MRLLRERQPLSRLTPTGAVKKQQKFFHNPSVSFADSIPQFAMVAPLRSQVRLRLSLAHWAYFALLRPQGARFVRPLYPGEPFG